MINITSCYSLVNTITAEQTQLPDLQAIIAQWHPVRIRRIDRYIQLCVAGGLSCVGGRKLPSNSGVYLASRYGAVTTSAKTAVQIERDGQLPKPLHFINTLGNSAGFYLTQLLQLTGNALVISQEQCSFEAALLHACLDLNSGQITTALVGGYDEVALPFAHQLERLQLPADTQALHEGSHWLLLERSEHAEQPLMMPQYFSHLTGLQQWLNDYPALPLQLCFTPNPHEQKALAGHRWSVYSPNRPEADSYSGAALTALLASTERSVHLNRNNNGHYCAVLLN